MNSKRHQTIRALLGFAGLLFAAGPSCQQSGDDLFDANHLIEVEIELAQQDWDELRQEGRGLATVFSACDREFEYSYFDATVVVDGEKIEHAGVRKKGFLGSLSVFRPSLKVNFGKFIPDQSHRGMKRLTLNNDRQDLSHSHQVMSYALFSEAGVVAPRCNFARVTVNGEDLGIYSHVESIKKPFLENHFNDTNGNLYEGQGADFTPELIARFERKTNKTAIDGGTPDRSDLDRVTQALSVGDTELLTALEQVIDLDAFLTFWAMEVIVGHWDGYSGNRNNFYVYHDPETDLFHFIPWGTDGSFGLRHAFLPDIPTSVYAWGHIAHRLYTNPETRALYQQKLQSLLNDVWDEDALLASVDRIDRLVSPDNSTLEVQRQFISNRRADILDELTGGGPEWPYPPISRTPECQEPQAVSGSFSASWGSTENFVSNENLSLNLTVNGEAQVFTQILNSVGLEENPDNGAGSLASIKVIGLREAGNPLVVVLNVMPSQVATGEVPFHGFETFGVVVELIQAEEEFKIIGYIGDGTISFDAAGTKPGDEVSGSFSGLMPH